MKTVWETTAKTIVLIDVSLNEQSNEQSNNQRSANYELILKTINQLQVSHIRSLPFDKLIMGKIEQVTTTYINQLLKMKDNILSSVVLE
jgi:hypothetical protein